jgi:hypothetical protein
VDPVRAIADAVLYEGYVLWPYRRSALKNQRRWTFGGVHPRAHSETHPDDRSAVRTECLVQAPADATLVVSTRFLHVVKRQPMATSPGGPVPVDELEVDGERQLSWDEAAERESATEPRTLAALEAGVREPIAIPAGREEEPLTGGGGEPLGALVRTWQELEGAIELRAQRLSDELFRITHLVTNTTPWQGGEREEVLRHSFCSTHSVLRISRGGFVSATDPGPGLEDEARSCRNEGTWPVLVGEPGDRRVMLSSPIILEDHPRIAPESPGDLFDGGEIDQLLILNILALTEEEKAEMRASDPRAREVLERTESLTPDELMSLHGAIREFGMARRA